MLTGVSYVDQMMDQVWGLGGYLVKIKEVYNFVFYEESFFYCNFFNKIIVIWRFNVFFVILLFFF